MAETPMGVPASGSIICPRCGGVFEKPIAIEVAGEKKYLPGHQVGDPKTCIVAAGSPFSDLRDRKQARSNIGRSRRRT